MWSRPLSEFNTKYSGGTDCFSFLHSCRPLYLDHKKFGKSTTRFSQTFIKALIVLRVNQHFWRIFYISVLLNHEMFIPTILLTVNQPWLEEAIIYKERKELFPFSIKIPVKYNTVLTQHWLFKEWWIDLNLEATCNTKLFL